MANSAFSRGTVISPSTIVLNSFTDVGGTTISYYQVGKLYFGFTLTTTVYQNGQAIGVQNPPADNTVNVARLAFKLGITVLQYYEMPHYGNGMNEWNGSAWVNTPPANQLDTFVCAILAN